MLHKFDFFCRQEGRRVIVLCVLDVPSVGGFGPGVWGMLGALGCWMLEFQQVCLEIFGHVYVTGVCGVVPVDGESTEEGTSPVDGDGVEFLEGLDEVVGVLLSDILDAKVVYG